MRVVNHRLTSPLLAILCSLTCCLGGASPHAQAREWSVPQLPQLSRSSGDTTLHDVPPLAEAAVLGSVGGSGTQALAVAGRYVFAGLAMRLVALDFGDPQRPVEVSGLWMPDIARGMWLAGRWLYVAAGYAGLRVVDVSDPAHLREVGTLASAGFAWNVVPLDRYLALADGAGGMRIVAVDDPAHPTEIGRLPLSDPRGLVVDMAIDGGYAYVADWWWGLRVADVRDPRQPREVAYFWPDVADPLALAVRGNVAYMIAQWDEDCRYCIRQSRSTLWVIDVAHPEAMRMRSSIDWQGAAGEMRLIGDRVFVAGGVAGLVVLNVADPDHPRREDSPPTEWTVAALAEGEGGTLYLADGASAGVSMVDARSGQVAQLGSWDMPTDVWNAELLRTDGNTVLVGNNSRSSAKGQLIRTVDVHCPYAPMVIASFATADQMALKFNRLYVADRALTVINLRNPMFPVTEGQLDLYQNYEHATAIAVAGDLVYVGTADGSDSVNLIVVDARDPSKLRRLSMTYLGSFILEAIAVSEGFAYLADYYGLTVMDVRDPSHPSQIGRLSNGYFTYNVLRLDAIAIGGTMALLELHDRAVVVLDIADPTHPRILNVLGIPSDVRDIAIQGSRAFVAASEGGVHVVDIGDPRALRDVGVIHTPDEATAVTVDGSTLLVAAGQAGLVSIGLNGNWAWLNKQHPAFLPSLLLGHQATSDP